MTPTVDEPPAGTVTLAAVSSNMPSGAAEPSAAVGAKRSCSVIGDAPEFR